MKKEKLDLGLNAEQKQMIKDYLQTHDFTSCVGTFDLKNSTPITQTVYNRSQRLLEQSWKEQMPNLNVKISLDNCSINHPLKYLEKTDGTFIGMKVADIYRDPKKFSECLDQFYEENEELIELAGQKYAQSLGKTVDDLTEEEGMFVIDKVATLVMDTKVQTMMVGQQVPEIATLTKKNGANSDFDDSRMENHSKIDFERQWNHSRVKGIGPVLSLEQMAEECPDELDRAQSVYDNAEEQTEEEILSGFLKTLDKDEILLLSCLKERLNQSDIAEKLGITQSAVSKRTKKLKEKMEEYMAS